MGLNMLTVKQRRFLWWCGALCLGFWIMTDASGGQEPSRQLVQGAGEQLMALANQSRAEQGLGKLQWDEGLAAAARDHCLRMAAEGPIAHRYGGEDDLSTRAGKAGAHFDLIEDARVASLVRVSGVTILSNHAQARAACAGDGPLQVGPGQLQPGFMMKWQDSELKQLPGPLTEKLASGQYHRAEIGSCPAHDVEGQFTAYRVAVLLY
jgi:hypothetical protein